MGRVYTLHCSNAICYQRILFTCTLMHGWKHEMGQIINYLFEMFLGDEMFMRTYRVN